MTIVGQGGGNDKLSNVADRLRWKLRSGIRLRNVEFTGELKRSNFSGIVGQKPLVWVKKKEWDDWRSAIIDNRNH